MAKWREVVVTINHTVLETMKVIDQAALQIAVVVDEAHRLKGTVTDGDIRRGILRGVPLDRSVAEVMNDAPMYAKCGQSTSTYYQMMAQKAVRHLPVVDDQLKLVDVVLANGFQTIDLLENPVVIMAGGLGTRLRPLTDEVPKPLLKVGGKPLLETIIEGFKAYGFYKFILSVNYKKEMIKESLNDGKELGVEIEYVDETKQLGTVGALSLMKERIQDSFIVMNGDILTKVNFKHLLDFHNENDAAATLCVRNHEYQIPYGVIETDNHRLISIKEKPIYSKFVNAGIYVLNRRAIDYIPHNSFFDMPDLFQTMLEQHERVSAFPVHEYWMDVGRISDFHKANQDFLSFFS
jgi:dTDP-glucose pyrophosphorylase